MSPKVAENCAETVRGRCGDKWAKFEALRNDNVWKCAFFAETLFEHKPSLKSLKNFVYGTLKSFYITCYGEKQV